MPMIFSWGSYVGEEVKVVAGPLSELVGVLQETRGSYGEIAYRNARNRQVVRRGVMLADLRPAHPRADEEPPKRGG